MTIDHSSKKGRGKRKTNVRRERENGGSKESRVTLQSTPGLHQQGPRKGRPERKKRNKGRKTN